MVPGFDPSAYTDEQLLLKIAELNRRIFIAEGSMGASAVDTLYAMYDQLQNEYRERNFMESWKKKEKIFNKVIETEPDLRQDKSEEKKEKPKRIKINIPVRTNKPVVPKD